MSLFKPLVFNAVLLMSMMLGGCFRPPYNDFQNDHRALSKTAGGAGVGAGMGALVGTVAGSTVAGAAIGGVAGGALFLYSNSEKKLIRELAREDIEYIQYADTRELVIPTDKYFDFNSHRIREQCYRGMNNVARLLALYSCNPIYVAAFSDAIGSKKAKMKLTQSRAEEVVGFLWAKGIPAEVLHAEGFGDKFSIADNYIIHGSAFNRRVEIQWINKIVCPREPQHVHYSK